MMLGIRRNASSVWLTCLACGLLILICSVSNSVSQESEKILILPFGVTSDNEKSELEAFSDHLDTRIRSAVRQLGGMYSVLSREEVDELLRGKSPPTTDEEARAAAIKSNSDLVVYGFLSCDDKGYRMQGVMWDHRTNRVTVTTDLKVTNIHALPGVLQFFISGINKRLQGSPFLPFYKTDPTGSASIHNSTKPRTLVNISRNEGPWLSPEITGALTGLDIGDIDGDKKNETVFVGDGGITISRFEVESLRSLTQFSQSPAVYLSAQVEDLDGDGVASLIVCYQAPSGIVSEIVRYVNRNLTLTDSFPNVILRAITDPSGKHKKILVGQKTDVEDMLSGEMIRFEIRSGKAVPDGKILLPPGTFLLSYASGHLGEKRDFLRIILNQDQRLMVFDNQNRLLATLNDRIYGLNRRIRLPMGKDYKDIIWPGRILLADTNGDGRNELLVMKSLDGKSEIQALTWDGTQLTKKWNTSALDGIISDFSISDFKNNGIQSLVLILVKQDPFLAFSGPRSVVFAYDFIP